MNNNIIEKIKGLCWHRMSAGVVDIGIKGKTLSDVYGRYSHEKERSYWQCIDKMNRFIDDYNLFIINYGITSNNHNSYTFEFLARDELGDKYLIVETAYTSKYYTSNQHLLNASRRYRKQLKTQNLKN